METAFQCHRNKQFSTRKPDEMELRISLTAQIERLAELVVHNGCFPLWNVESALLRVRLYDNLE
jgi:hypothetical protein